MLEDRCVDQWSSMPGNFVRHNPNSTIDEVLNYTYKAPLWLTVIARTAADSQFFVPGNAIAAVGGELFFFQKLSDHRGSAV
jgi:hypothetical protein